MSTLPTAGEITWSLEDTLFVSMSKPKPFKQGPGQNRTGFQKTMFDKQYYVTITLTDCSKGHGVVKSVILRNPPPQFLAKIDNANYWEIRKQTMTLVTEEDNRIERTFRIVYLKTPDGDEVMSNTLEQQMRNLAKGSLVKGPTGDMEQVIGYVNSKGEIIPLIEQTLSEDEEDAETP